MGRISCNERSVCVYIECIIFSLRVATDLWCFVQCDETVFFVYMLLSKFENMQQQQQPLPIYFGVEFDLNDNFFLLEWERERGRTKVAPVETFAHICNTYTHAHTLLFSYGLYWIHHLISNNRQPSNLLLTFDVVDFFPIYARHKNDFPCKNWCHTRCQINLCYHIYFDFYTLATNFVFTGLNEPWAQSCNHMNFINLLINNSTQQNSKVNWNLKKKCMRQLMSESDKILAKCRSLCTHFIY